jgi:hypothetical protein
MSMPTMPPPVPATTQKVSRIRRGVTVALVAALPVLGQAGGVATAAAASAAPKAQLAPAIGAAAKGGAVIV